MPVPSRERVVRALTHGIHDAALAEHIADTLLSGQQAALTTQLTTVTFSSPSTSDYAVQDLTQTTPFGFKTSDEGQTVLSVIANLQTRMAEMEARLVAAGIVTG